MPELDPQKFGEMHAHIEHIRATLDNMNALVRDVSERVDKHDTEIALLKEAVGLKRIVITSVCTVACSAGLYIISTLIRGWM